MSSPVSIECKVNVGDKAPEFTLPDTELKPRSLKDFQGKKVVLAFFVGAFTSNCTKEMCSFRDSTVRLADMNAQVVGVSVNDPFSNKAFAEENRFTFPILSDYNRQVVKMYGLELANFAGLAGYTAAKRSIFILDREGIVRYKWISDNPAVEPDYGKIERA
jgi:glutaredoxin-dependent peroxiredoxin